MDLPTLQDLLTIPTQDETLDQEVLPELRLRSVRVTDWLPGGVYRALAYVVALLRVDVRRALAALAAAGFEDYAFGFATPPNELDVTAWAPLVAQQRYGLTQLPATHTLRTLRLTNDSNATYGPLQAGALIVAFPSGNRYILDQTIPTLPAAGDVDATFRSEFTTDSAAGRVYNDPSNATLTLVTSVLPGVTASNPAPVFTPVSAVGNGSGIVMPSGAPVGAHTVAVRIDTSGSVAGSSVAWSTALDGGAWQARSGFSVTNLGGSGITIALVDGTGVPSFVAGTIYYFATPGSDIVVLGRDVETAQELGARCRAQWPLLALVKDAAGNWIPTSPTESAYAALARAASDQVKTVLVTAGTVNNEVRIYVAGQGATLPTSVLATVQAWLNSRSMLTDLPVVLSPVPRTITLGGVTIRVQQGQLATAQATLQQMLQRYLGGTDPKVPLSLNPRIDHAYLVTLLRTTPGVISITDGTLAINGVAADLQLPVTPGAIEQAQWSQQAATAFLWQTV